EAEAGLTTRGDNAIPGGHFDHIARADPADDFGVPDVDDVGVQIEFDSPAIHFRLRDICDGHIHDVAGAPIVTFREGHGPRGWTLIVVGDRACAGGCSDCCPDGVAEYDAEGFIRLDQSVAADCDRNGL